MFSPSSHHHSIERALTMPATVRPASHPPRQWHGAVATSPNMLFDGSCGDQAKNCKQIIQSSFGGDWPVPVNTSPSANGFVYAAVSAYCDHYHLTIRPEDIWFAILTQLSFYINAHAEDLRSLFVAHEGQKELEVITLGTVQTVDFGKLALHMTKEIKKNVLDSGLCDWIMPNFTTTTHTDFVTAAILMMGTMQNYFQYSGGLTCGIPSVTLLGEKADWVAIRQRLDKLPHFGEEARQFATLLIPILDFFVRSFEEPDSPAVVDFWSKIAHRESNSSGPSYLSGWLTAFCFWDADGKSFYNTYMSMHILNKDKCCEINGAEYHQLDIAQIPVGYVSVPVKVDDNGHEIKTRMVAGSVGIAVWSSGDKLDTSQTHAHWKRPGFQREYVPMKPEVGLMTGLDTLQPVSGWWMYELKEGNN